MMDYNEDYEYAEDKLFKTIVRLKDGNPVRVDRIFRRDKQVQVRTIGRRAEDKLVKLRDLDLSSPPIGFVNYRFMALYVSRIPKRRDWKQGLRDNNCICPDGFSLSDFVAGSVLHNCITNKYPKINTILDKLNKPGNNRDGLAWHRHWAIDRNLIVRYKSWGRVGLFNTDKMDIEFDNQMAFLRESFEESRNENLG